MLGPGHLGPQGRGKGVTQGSEIGRGDVGPGLAHRVSQVTPVADIGDASHHDGVRVQPFAQGSDDVHLLRRQLSQLLDECSPIAGDLLPAGGLGRADGLKFLQQLRQGLSGVGLDTDRGLMVLAQYAGINIDMDHLLRAFDLGISDEQPGAHGQNHIAFRDDVF